MNPFDLLKNAGQLKEQAKKIQDEIKNQLGPMVAGMKCRILFAKVPAAVKWLL